MEVKYVISWGYSCMYTTQSLHTIYSSSGNIYTSLAIRHGKIGEKCNYINIERTNICTIWENLWGDPVRQSATRINGKQNESDWISAPAVFGNRFRIMVVTLLHEHKSNEITGLKFIHLPDIFRFSPNYQRILLNCDVWWSTDNVYISKYFC